MLRVALIVAVLAASAHAALVQTSGEQVTSGGEDVVAYGPPDFTDAPLCTGPTVEGRKLATTSGTLYDDSATSYASALAGVQFRVADDASGTNAANISGVTAFTFWLPYSTLRGKYIGVRATATNVAGSTTSDSIWIGPVNPHRN